MDFLQPPDPPGAGHCLRCGTCVTEDEQRGGVCIDCQPAEDGEQSAFPVAANEYAGHGPSHGITIRDYFAAKFAAAQATATSADSNFINPEYVDPRDGRSVSQKIAETSYALADAMLAARVKP
ncbi:hypothetical protein [Pseudomonas auratipiscis]|uniref:Uncharacterized protein n=1 Tax=Pseudomonas auratipiscis TaxID=3115853 RepID=A0AB35WXR0_9PSED|nr:MULTISPECIES: hypothetical protein [unclassified Pseudomonas]MEE1869040.1 hypothetical protein [Pseudomonas sp. 120P]MEE1959687.1 hypothetical protein [Pseudomonas sp. 119P]